MQAMGLSYNLGACAFGGFGLIGCQRLVDLGFVHANGWYAAGLSLVATVAVCVAWRSGPAGSKSVALRRVKFPNVFPLPKDARKVVN